MSTTDARGQPYDSWKHGEIGRPGEGGENATAIFLDTGVIRQPICGLDEACLTGDRLRLDHDAATAVSRFLTPQGFAFLLSH